MSQRVLESFLRALLVTGMDILMFTSLLITRREERAFALGCVFCAPFRLYTKVLELTV